MGHSDDRWKQQEVEWDRSLGAKNSAESCTSRGNSFYKSYFNSMKTHREHKNERDPAQMYDTDLILSPECICTGIKTNIVSSSRN